MSHASSAAGDQSFQDRLLMCKVTPLTICCLVLKPKKELGESQQIDPFLKIQLNWLWSFVTASHSCSPFRRGAGQNCHPRRCPRKFKLRSHGLSLCHRLSRRLRGRKTFLDISPVPASQGSEAQERPNASSSLSSGPFLGPLATAEKRSMAGPHVGC